MFGGNTEQFNTNRIVVLQKRVIRSIGNASYLAHTDELFNRYNILRYEELWELNIYKHMYKHFHKLLPRYFNNYFNVPSNLHKYETRKKEDFQIAKHKTSLFSKSIKVIGPKLWNELPVEVKESKHMNYFKRHVIKFIKSKK